MTRAKMLAAPCGALFLFLGGCVTADKPSVSDEVVELHEARLLAPYQEARAVVSNALEIDITANFDHQVARPTINPAVHDYSRTEMDGAVVQRWLNRGGLQTPLKFQVGNMKFVSLLTATLRVRESGEYTMNARATGQVTEAKEGDDLRNWSEIRIADGMYRPQ